MVEDTARSAVGLSIAEFVPRQVIRLQQVRRTFPLIEHPGTVATRQGIVT
jgi:hypothetical protein